MPVSDVDNTHEINFKNNTKVYICISVQYPWQSIRIHVHSNNEITIRILSVSVKIADIRKISIRGYISAHLW